MEFIRDIVMETLRGQALLDWFDAYYSGLGELNQVFLLLGVGVLVILGIFGIIKATLRLTSVIIKVIIIVAVVYYVLFVMLDLF